MVKWCWVGWVLLMGLGLVVGGKSVGGWGGLLEFGKVVEMWKIDVVMVRIVSSWMGEEGRYILGRVPLQLVSGCFG